MSGDQPPPVSAKEADARAAVDVKALHAAGRLEAARERYAELVTRHARAAHPRLFVVARAPDAEQVARLRQAGASAVVQPEFEAGLEVIRHALRRYGIGSSELFNALASRRVAFYRPIAPLAVE